MVAWVVNSLLQPRRASQSLNLFALSPCVPASLLPYLPSPSSRDAKPVTVTPLDSALTDPSQVAENTAPLSPLECALTDCDAHKPFRMRSYKKCRVSPHFPSLSSFASCPSPLPTLSASLSFHALTNCKSCNFFVLTFIQNARGVYPILPKMEPSIPRGCESRPCRERAIASPLPRRCKEEPGSRSTRISL